MRLSPDCINTSVGGVCGFCEKCGRKVKYFNNLAGQPILHIIGPSKNDHPDIIEKCEQNKSLKDLAPDFKKSWEIKENG